MRVCDTHFSLLPGGKTFRLSTRAEYDGAGRPVRAVLRYDDSLEVVYGYQYDGSGKVSKWTLASGGGYLMTTDAYAYATVHVPASLAPSRSPRAAIRAGFQEGSVRDALGRRLERGGGEAWAWHPAFSP